MDFCCCSHGIVPVWRKCFRLFEHQWLKIAYNSNVTFHAYKYPNCPILVHLMTDALCFNWNRAVTIFDSSSHVRDCFSTTQLFPWDMVFCQNMVYPIVHSLPKEIEKGTFFFRFIKDRSNRRMYFLVQEGCSEDLNL